MAANTNQCGAAIALAALGFLVSVVSAFPQSPVLTTKGQQLDRVLDEVRTEGVARIIVEFSVPDIDIDSDGGLIAHKANVRAMQDAIISQTLGRSDGVSRMAISPMFAVRASLAEIERLAADARVVKIYSDKLNRPTLIQSVSLIRATTMRSDGGDGRGMIVAVIDTGVERNHEFLKNKVLVGACFSNGGVDGPDSTCSNGQSQQIGPAAGEPCSGNSDCIHGTHVAGIAVGNNTAQGAGEPRFGVAPRAALIAINVFSNIAGELQAFDSDIVKGLEFVFEKRNTFGLKKVAAVNMSLGDNVPHSTKCGDAAAETFMIKRLRKARIATVIASGNNGFRNAVSSPGCIAAAVTVSASNKKDRIAEFSNMGALVDLMAPGALILSSVQGDDYAFFSGTSMAAPHVAGAFAGLRTLHPAATVDEITDALKATGKPIADDRIGGSFTRRRIRLDKADDALDSSKAVAATGTVRGPSASLISVQPATR